MKQKILSLYDKLLGLAARLSPLAFIMLRVAVGMVFIQTGWGKLQDIPTFVERFREWGIPAPELQAPFIAVLEFVGGAALLLGLATRFFGIMLSGTMVVAMITVVWKPDSTFLDLFNFDEFTYLMILLSLVLLGAGPWSIDTLIKRKLMPPK